MKLKYLILVVLLAALTFSVAFAETAAPAAPAFTWDLTDIINAAIALLVGWLIRYAIPWIRVRTNAWQRQLLVDLIGTAVMAAEQKLGSGKGKEKLDYVINDLHSRGVDIDLAAIEAAVKTLPENMTSALLDETENG